MSHEHPAIPSAMQPTTTDTQITTRVWTITPDIAAAWLKLNTHNRPLSMRLVERLSKEILEGRWVVNGQAIIIGRHGRLLDGQHRLHAIIQSGMTVEALVTMNVRDETFSSIDTGRVRRSSDVLSIAGYKNSKTLGSVASLLMSWDIGEFGDHFQIPATRAVEIIEENYPDLPGALEFVLGFLKKATLRRCVSILAACFYKMSKIDYEYAQSFMTDVLVGANLGSNDPVLALRRRLDVIRTNTSLDRWQCISLIIQAWNFRVRGLMSTSLSTWAPGTRRQFPVLEHPGHR